MQDCSLVLKMRPNISIRLLVLLMSLLCSGHGSRTHYLSCNSNKFFFDSVTVDSNPLHFASVIVSVNLP